MDEPRWLTDEEAGAWRSYLYSTQLLMRALDRQLQRDSGLTHNQYAILVQLSGLPGRSSRITELASLMDHSQSRMSHAVASLVRAGYLRRETDPADGRVVHAVLTDVGTAALEAAAPGHVRCVRENLFDGLDADQIAQLRDICGVMLDRLGAPGDCPSPAE